SLHGLWNSLASLIPSWHPLRRWPTACPQKVSQMQPLRRPERRRTVRVSLQIPLKVQARVKNGETVTYVGFTQKVSGDGGLLLLDAPVLPGEPLLLTNEWTSETVRCFVTCVKDRREPKGVLLRYVGVGFAFPETDFWHIVFPK